MRPISVLIAGVAAAFLLSSVAVAEPRPAFGPQTFERTTGETDVYLETFDVATSGEYVLYLRNGDGESGMVSSGSVEIDGVPVVAPDDFTTGSTGLRRPLSLDAGTVELRVELGGEPGTFLTIAVAPRGTVPRFAHGRLVLPWARHDAERGLAIAIKNGSTRWPRAFRAVFFAPSGEPLAASPRLVVPPRGSLVLPTGALLEASTWTIGSVEIYYAGPGAARLFGSGRQVDTLAGETIAVPLEHAGHRVFAGLPDGPPEGGRLSRE